MWMDPKAVQGYSGARFRRARAALQSVLSFSARWRAHPTCHDRHLMVGRRSRGFPRTIAADGRVARAPRPCRLDPAVVERRGDGSRPAARASEEDQRHVEQAVHETRRESSSRRRSPGSSTRSPRTRRPSRRSGTSSGTTTSPVSTSTSRPASRSSARRTSSNRGRAGRASRSRSSRRGSSSTRTRPTA